MKTNFIYTLAIDPGGNKIGLALGGIDRALLGSETVEGLTNIEASRVLRAIDEAIAYHAAKLVDIKLVVVIEYPPAGFHGAVQVRQAANLILKHLKAKYPRRIRVKKVTPTTWQAMTTKGMPGKDPKARSLARAAIDYGHDDHRGADEADALNILTYGRAVVRWGYL